VWSTRVPFPYLGGARVSAPAVARLPGLDRGRITHSASDMTIVTTIPELYTLLADSKTKTGFIAHPLTLANGRKFAGLYRGFGATVLVERAPGRYEKGFRSLGAFHGGPNGRIRFLTP